MDRNFQLYDFLIQSILCLEYIIHYLSHNGIVFFKWSKIIQMKYNKKGQNIIIEYLKMALFTVFLGTNLPN